MYIFTIHLSIYLSMYVRYVQYVQSVYSVYSTHTLYSQYVPMYLEPWTQYVLPAVYPIQFTYDYRLFLTHALTFQQGWLFAADEFLLWATRCTDLSAACQQPTAWHVQYIKLHVFDMKYVVLNRVCGYFVCHK